MPQFKHRTTNEIRDWHTDNEDVFRRLHKLGWRRVEDAPVEVEAEPTGTPLPDDFPGRDELADVDINTFETLRAFMTENNLESIWGVGPKTAADIREALG